MRRSLALVLALLAGGCLAGPRHVRVARKPADAACVGGACSSCPTTLLSPTEPVTGVDLATLGAGPAADDGGHDEAPAPSASASSSAEPPLTFPTGSSPAMTYAAMDGAACEAALTKRGIAFTPVSSANGVDRPMRLAGPLHGVTFHGQGLPPSSIYEIVDCRLVLALDDFAKVLAAHDVTDVLHMSIYRPPPKSAKPGQKSRHEAALAIDVGTLVKKDGTKLSVLADWHGGIGQKTCGAGAGPTPVTKQARELRDILCATHEAKLFHVMLTPNYNKPHDNHFHLEVTRGVKWMILH